MSGLTLLPDIRCSPLSYGQTFLTLNLYYRDIWYLSLCDGLVSGIALWCDAQYPALYTGQIFGIHPYVSAGYQQAICRVHLWYLYHR